MARAVDVFEEGCLTASALADTKFLRSESCLVPSGKRLKVSPQKYDCCSVSQQRDNEYCQQKILDLGKK